MFTWQCPRCRGKLVHATEDRLHCGACVIDFERHGMVWRFADGFRPEGFPLVRSMGLQAIEERHFWFGPRDRLLIGLLKRHLDPRASGQNEVKIIDVGCGTGRFLALLESLGYRAVGIDGHAEPLERARKRCPEATLGHADICRLPFATGEFDAAVALDVLEHVDPERLLREVARVVRPDGGLLISIPALPWLWSRMDELAGHRCRYTVRHLREELIETGWTVRSWTHYQFLLLPLVFISRFLSRQAERPSERRPPAWLNRLLAQVNLAEVQIFGRLRLPWGSSLVAWAERM